MPAFTEQKLKRFARNISPQILHAFLVPNADDVLIEAGITSALILQHFMGQMFVESGGFTTLSENLNYSAARLPLVFGKAKFPNASIAAQYAGNPVKLANYVYGGRMGNKNLGDGWKYRGGGLIQLTGSDNYRALARKLGIDIWNHPDIVRDPQTALQIAAQFFKVSGAASAAAEDNVKRVTLLVNGGYNGELDREAETNRAAEIFIDDPDQSGNVHSTSPDGLLGDFENVPETPVSVDTDTPQAPVVAPVPMTMEQAKQLQQTLKDRNYSPGDVNGNIHNPSTVGAISTLQKQQGLPVTGVVDDVTEDAIQDAPNKVVSEDRANENADTLRGKGSQTIVAADNINLATHGISVGGLGSLGVGAGSLIAAAGDQADQITQITDHVPGLSEKLAVYITGHLGLVGLIVLGVGLLYIASRIYKNNRYVINERVRKAQTGEDMSH